MASGCILGDCPVCNELVYEDEWSGVAFERYSKFIHVGSCQQTYERTVIRTNKIRQLERANETLTEENLKLRRQIQTGQLFFDFS